MAKKKVKTAFYCQNCGAQYDKWKKLQNIKGHENDCGRPGINGGFIDNPNARFGVNCYGHKPKMTPEERELMDEQQIYPLTPEERRFEKKVKSSVSFFKERCILF